MQIQSTIAGRLIDLAALVVKDLAYYITLTIALGAVALAIGIGVAVGLGGQNSVAENIDGWMRSARATVEEDEE